MPRRTLLQKDPRDDLIQVPIEARLQFAVLPSSIADPWDRAVGDYLNPVLLGVKPVSRITTSLLTRSRRFVNLSLTIPAPFSSRRFGRPGRS